MLDVLVSHSNGNSKEGEIGILYKKFDSIYDFFQNQFWKAYLKSLSFCAYGDRIQNLSLVEIRQKQSFSLRPWPVLSYQQLKEWQIFYLMDLASYYQKMVYSEGWGNWATFF